MSSEWPTVTIGDVAKIKHGFAFKGEFFTDKATPNVLVTPGNFVIGGGFQIGKPKYYAGPLPDGYALAEGEVVVTMTDLSKASDTLGYAAKVPTTPDVTYWHNQRIGLLQVKDEQRVCKDWLHYLMRTREYRAWIVGSASGTTVKHTSPSRIESFSFKLPTLKEQRTIAEILGAFDDRIDNLRQINATLEAMAQALFKSWLVDFDGVLPEEMQASELGLIPKGWRVGTLADLCELKYGKALKASKRRVGEIPVYGSGGITGHHDEALVTKPTIIVGRKGTVGTLYWQSQSCFPIDTVFYVKPKVSLHFCYYAMMRMKLHTLNTDAAVPGLNRNNAYRQPVVIPEIEKLTKWDTITSDFRARMDNAASQSRTLAALRDTLLPRLISGTLRIPAAERMLP